MAVFSYLAPVNNYLLPMWMISFGIVLLRHRLSEEKVAST